MFLTLFSLVTQVTQRAESNNIPLGGFTPPSPAYSEGSENADTALANLESFVSNLIGFLTAMGSLFFVIYFITGAFSWITSGGDKGKLENARNRMMYGALGMILIIASYSLLGLLSGLIGLDFLNPAEQIRNIVAPTTGEL
ncbi:MAG TPA: hypothetical protein VGA89_00315 [Patescibacteria group bacterium]|jgi:hypothetical protein